MNSELMPVPDLTEVELGAMTLAEEAEAIEITDANTYQAAAFFLRSACKGLTKKIHESFDPLIKKAHDTHKSLIAERKKQLEPVLEAERLVKGKIAAYSREQDRIRREREAEARRRAKLLAEADTLQRAVDLENQGRAAEAEALIEKTPAPVAPVVSEPAPKAEGVSIRKVWKFEVVDVTKIKPAYLKPDTAKIGKVVRALGADAAEAVGEGIEVYQEESVAARA